MSDIDLDKFCMTDKGLFLWKDVAQRYADEIEWHRSSLNPNWGEVRSSERDRCAKIAESYKDRDPAGDGDGYWASEEIAAAIRGTS